MTRERVRTAMLSQLTEDFTGLWELAATPDAPPADEVIATLDELVAEDLVAIYRGTKFSSEERRLPVDEARRLIRERGYWQWTAPEKGVHLRALATPAGSDAYFAGAKHGDGVERS